MTKTLSAWALWLVVLATALLLGSEAFAQQVPNVTGRGMDDAVMKFKEAAGAGNEAIVGWARGIFAALAGLGFISTVAECIRESRTLQETMLELLGFLVATMVAMFVLENGRDWALLILNDLRHLGEVAGGVDSASPNALVDEAIALFRQVRASDQGWFDLAFGCLMSIALIAMFAYLGAHLAVAYIKGAFIVYKGQFVLGFGAAKWARKYAENYFEHTLTVAAEVMGSIFVMGISMRIVRAYIQVDAEGKAADISAEDQIALFVLAVMLCFAMKEMPKMLGGLISGMNPSYAGGAISPGLERAMNQLSNAAQDLGKAAAGKAGPGGGALAGGALGGAAAGPGGVLLGAAGGALAGWLAKPDAAPPPPPKPDGDDDGDGDDANAENSGGGGDGGGTIGAAAGLATDMVVDRDGAKSGASVGNADATSEDQVDGSDEDDGTDEARASEDGAGGEASGAADVGTSDEDAGYDGAQSREMSADEARDEGGFAESALGLDDETDANSANAQAHEEGAAAPNAPQGAEHPAVNAAGTDASDAATASPMPQGGASEAARPEQEARPAQTNTSQTPAPPAQHLGAPATAGEARGAVSPSQGTAPAGPSGPAGAPQPSSATGPGSAGVAPPGASSAHSGPVAAPPASITGNPPAPNTPPSVPAASSASGPAAQPGLGARSGGTGLTPTDAAPASAASGTAAASTGPTGGSTSARQAGEHTDGSSGGGRRASAVPPPLPGHAAIPAPDAADPAQSSTDNDPFDEAVREFLGENDPHPPA